MKTKLKTIATVFTMIIVVSCEKEKKECNPQDYFENHKGTRVIDYAIDCGGVDFDFLPYIQYREYVLPESERDSVRRSWHVKK